MEAAGWERIDRGELAQITGGPSMRTTALAEEEPVAFKSVRNGKWVAAEKNYASPYTGVVRARSANLSTWEVFGLQYDEATDTWALKAHANGKYVAVEKNYTGSSKYVLRARSSGVNTWEQFILWYNETDDVWALQSVMNGLFVSMENNYTGKLQYVLRARSATPAGSWEEFELYDVLMD